MNHSSRAVTDMTGESGMTKLKRNADGSYSGTYKGRASYPGRRARCRCGRAGEPL